MGRLLVRLIGLLGPERGLALRLALANAAVAAVLLAEPILFGRIVDAMAGGRDAWPTIGLWAALGAGGAAAAAAIAYEADKLAHRRRLAAMADCFAHALALPQSFHGGRHSGALLRTMLAGADNLFSFWLSVLRDHLSAALGLLALAPVAIMIEPRIAALLIALGAAYAAANVFVVRHTNAAQRGVERWHGAVAGRATDVVANVAVVQSFTRAEEELRAMRGLMGSLLDAQTPVLRWWALITVFTRTAATATVVAVLALGAALHAQGAASVGDIVSLVGLSTLMIARLEQVSGFGARLFFQLRPIAEYLAVMDAAPGPPERADPLPLPVGPAPIRFEAVSHAWEDGAPSVTDLDFEALPGQTIALVGPTGAGKSTALALLRRAADPDAGRILIGGVDIRDARLADLRGRISVVFQEASLFHRSIAENIAVGRPDASPTEIEAAARSAQAHAFIAAKPEGYQTMVAERGANLSGGERQRLAIARAFLKDAPILILDEATSALDPSTEAEVQAALAALRRGRTTFVIAHRLSTVRDADMILMMVGGRIVERGRFEDLARAGGPFSRLATAGGFAPA